MSHPLDSLLVTLVAPATVTVGAPVPIALHLTNRTDRPLELHVVGREITFDVVVTRADGSIVWQRLAHTPIQGILQIKTLAPHEDFVLRARWHQHTNGGDPVPPGIYSVEGVVPTETPNHPLRSAPVLLQVHPEL